MYIHFPVQFAVYLHFLPTFYSKRLVVLDQNLSLNASL